MCKNWNTLLLGAYGFIGTNLMKYIDSVGLGYKVIAFDRYQNHPMGISFQCVDVSYSGDFSDESVIETIFAKHSIDLVIHRISTTIPIGGQNAIYDIESNLLPTIKLLDIMGKYHCKKIVFISSGGAVYGDGREPHSERDAVYPKSSYGVVKVAIEKYLFQYALGAGIKPFVLRLSNPYGRYHYSMKQGIVNVALNKARQKRVFRGLWRWYGYKGLCVC